MDRLDAMLDLTGEIAVARGRLLGLLATQRAAGGDRARLAAEELDRLLGGLQEQVMQMRLVPLGIAFRQHLRTVRDISALQGKVIRLVTEGDEVQVDASIVDRIRDPLTHMVRNATDHGIEYPAERNAAGKDPSGTVTLRARHEGGTVVIEVSDDGAGLDLPRIRERGRAMGIAGVETMSERELHDLVFRPGFSTAQAVSEISGRGVGMDIVRRDIESLRGSVVLHSERGKGTTATIRLPLTLAIIDGLAVSVGGDTYVVPLDAVTECMQLPAEDTARAEPTGILSLRGESLPYVRLRSRFGCAGRAPDRESVVVVRDAVGQAGFVVDGLQGERQAVLKPLGRLFAGLPGISGSTIVGDGRVALILDVPAILGETRAAQRSN
jgi:two-component system chemotaxis sensor kinase CheA